MLCGDVGQDHYEEVDLIEKGANYGWNGYEGHSCFKGYCEDAGHLESMRKLLDFILFFSFLRGYACILLQSPHRISIGRVNRK